MELADLRKKKAQFKKVFFYRICGTGMGAAAYLFKERGFQVEGGDVLFTPPMSDYLKSTHIPCHEMGKVTDAFLKTFDLIVVGNVVPKGGEDASRIESLQVPYTSFPCALGGLVLDEDSLNVVGIAGTHGKTTTTYLLAQLFENLGENPGYFIGGVLADRASSKWGGGKYFFIESDEYDSSYFHKMSKFHFYGIDHLILTSLEFDHADIFTDLTAIEKEFRQLFPNVTKSYLLSSDYPSCQSLYGEYKNKDPQKKWFLYGENSSLGPRNIQHSPLGSTFELALSGDVLTFETNLLGIQNILNLTGAIGFAHSQGFAIPRIRESIKNLKMVKRRQEVVGTYRKAIVIDDFAHHPRAVRLTLESIRMRYPRRKVMVIFEPNSATARSSLFQDEFARSLQIADGIIIIKPMRKSNIPNFGSIDCDHIIQQLQKIKNIDGKVVENRDDLIKGLDQFLDKNLKGENVILTLSNGTLLGLWETLSFETKNGND